MVETCGQLRSSLFMFRPFRKHNGNVLTCNLMTFGDLIIGFPIGLILCFRKSTWQQAECVLLLLFRRFVIIPSSRNTCHASSSLFVICCFTSSCPDCRDRTVDFGLKKTVRHCTGLSEKLTYFDLCFDFPAACDSYFKTFNKFYHRK